MLMEDIRWHDDYAIGVEEIDAEHQEFFRIVLRLHLGVRNHANNQWVVSEGIKFLKRYVLQHFADEENYMRMIGYKFIEQHINQHNIMRVRVVPKIEGQLERHNYSDEAVEKFLKIVSLWLSRHILVHDKAIAWEKSSPESL